MSKLLLACVLMISGCATGRATVDACAVTAERCTVVRMFSGDAAVRAAQLQPTKPTE